MAAYLTDRLRSISEEVRNQVTATLADDLSDFERPAVLLCCASSDEARDKLCAAYGCEPLPRLEGVEHQPGDRALVGSWSPDGSVHWALRTFDR